MVFALRSMVVAGLATVLAVIIGVIVLSRGDGGDVLPAPSPEAASTSLEDLDTTNLAIGRAAFCDGVPDDAVGEVLGADVEDATSYDNGERAQVTGEVRDVAHEFGCVWSAGRFTARGWVFAPPVTRGQARELIERATGQQGCRPAPDAPAFGRPTVALVCDSAEDKRASYQGLFGDAWLTCSVAGPPATADADIADRAEPWCADVATAASVEPESESE